MEGQDGSPPESEVIPGYTFCRWPDSEYYTNVQEDYTIRGEYYAGDVETYKVEFVDYDGRMLYAPQQIARGQDASRPSSPKRDGYTFVGWDNQRFCIKKDTVITAQYQKGDLKTYFLQYKGRCPDKDGFYNLLKEEWVVEGQDGSPPESELIPGYTFCRWPDSEFYTNVRRNYTIFGKYYTGDVETYKVEFVDYDGRMLYAPQYITEGAEPDVPKNPTRDGYTFTGWDKTFYQITAPIKIRAVYIPGTHNTHKVKFYGKITGVQSWVVLKEAQVPTGYDASAPIPPVYAGYVFTGWDSSYTNIQSNKYIYASYQSEDSVTGTNKLRIYKTLLSKLDLSDELEDALIQLGEYLANADNDGPTSRSLVVSGELIVLIATLIYSCGVYLARPLFKSIANCITTCFGHVADAVVDAIEAELEVLINEGESEAIAIGLGDIAGQYGLFECKEAADAMAEYLRKQKQEFKFITMKYPAYSSGYIISFTREALFGINSEESIISKNGYHYGIEYYGIVYCNVHPLGLPRAVWEADFWGDGQAERTITPP